MSRCRLPLLALALALALALSLSPSGASASTLLRLVADAATTAPGHLNGSDATRREDLTLHSEGAPAEAAAVDPRTKERTTFTNPGTFAAKAVNVVVMLIGDGFEKCDEVILNDVFSSLDINTVLGAAGRLPFYANRKYANNAKSFGCAATVRGWWQTLAAYRGKNGYPPSVYNYGVYRLESYEIPNGELTPAIVESVAARIVNPGAGQQFQIIPPAQRNQFVGIVVLGSGVSYPALEAAQKKYPAAVNLKCAVGFYQSALFPKFHGGVVAYAYQNSRWNNAACNVFPAVQLKQDTPYLVPNGCNIDFVMTHILTRLADLMVNPSQFNYKGSSAIGIPSASAVPGYVCKDAVLNGKYKKVQVACSPGMVCDLRKMSAYTGSVSKDGTKLVLSPKPDPASPEAKAILRAYTAKFGGTRFFVANVLSERFFHFVQPYRTSAGACDVAYTPPVTTGGKCGPV